VSISPIDCKPATKTEAATKRATTEIILPIPVKNLSVSANTSLLPLWRISSQMIASMKETNTATSTLIEIFEFVVSSTIKETNNRIIGKTGRIADRKSTRLNSSHVSISYAVFCLKKKKTKQHKLTNI